MSQWQPPIPWACEVDRIKAIVLHTLDMAHGNDEEAKRRHIRALLKKSTRALFKEAIRKVDPIILRAGKTVVPKTTSKTSSPEGADSARSPALLENAGIIPQTLGEKPQTRVTNGKRGTISVTVDPSRMYPSSNCKCRECGFILEKWPTMIGDYKPPSVNRNHRITIDYYAKIYRTIPKGECPGCHRKLPVPEEYQHEMRFKCMPAPEDEIHSFQLVNRGQPRK